MVRALVGFGAGIIASLTASYLTPRFNRMIHAILSSVFHVLNPERFDLTGKWKQVFTEPGDKDPNAWCEETEVVELKHVGNYISGIGKTKILHRTFIYDLRVKHNMLFGSYIKKGEKGNLSGHGMAQMIVSADRLKMKGQATWFDHDTNQIESSACAWEKIS